MSIPLRVLMLEDKLSDAELSVIELRKSGFEPDWQRVETEADYVNHLDPSLDLILADYSLPQFDGLRALQLLQQRGLDIPFILISGTIGEDIAVKAMKQGATDYLLKDRLTRLGPAVKSALEQKRLRDERKQAEEALRRAEEKYRNIFENSLNGIFQSTPDGRFILVNPALARMWGYDSPEDLLASVTNTARQVYVDPGRRAEHTRLLKEQGGSVIGFEYQAYRKDGTTIWISENVNSVVDANGNLRYYEGVVEDISERKRAEERLHLQSTALEAAANAIVITDREGAILWVNPAFTKLTGYSLEEAAGQNPRIISSGKQDRPFYQRLWETILSGQVWHSEIINRRKDGSLYPEEMTITPLRDERGEIVNFIAIKQDISDRKQAEAALHEANHRAIREYERLLERLAHLAQAVGTARDLTSVFRGLREFAEASVPCNGLFVSLYDPGKQERICVYSGGDGEEDDVSMLPPMPMNDGPHSRAIASGQIVVTDDLQSALAGKPVVTLGADKDPRLPQSSLAVPLTVLGRVVGAFEVQSVQPSAYRQQHITAMRMAANLAAIAAENVQMLERERQLRLGAEMSEERYRTLAEAAQDAIFIVNRDDRVEYVNSFAAGQFGSRAEELIGRTRAALFPPQVAEHQTHTLREVFETGNSIYEETKTVYPIGEVWIGTRLAPIRNAAGEVRAVLGIARDITERKRAEVALRRHADELETLYESALALSQLLDLREIGQRIIETFDEKLDWHHAAIRLYHPESDRLELLAFSHPDIKNEVERRGVEKRFNDLISRPGLGLSGWVVQHGQAVRSGDVSHDPRYADTYPGLNSGLYLPLQVGGRTIGVIAVESEKANAFSEADERLLTTLAAHAAVAIENANLFAETRRRLENMQALHIIDRAIASSLDLRLTLQILLKQTMEQLNVDAADVLTYNPLTQTLDYADGQGFRTDALQHTHLRLGEGYAGLAGLERKIIHLSDLKGRRTDFLRSPNFKFEEFVSYLCVPLIAKNQIKGMLELFHRSPFQPDQNWMDFVETLAGHAAIAIDNASLFTDLQRANAELMLAYDTTLEGWSKALDLRDKETEGHTQRVTEMAEKLAHLMGVRGMELVHIHRGALLHDMGKMGVPDNILLKPGALTDEEWKIMRMHPVHAYEMLSHIAYLRPALDIPYCHHEKWDGTGYPRGLKGEEIPLAARLFAVVDVFDALRADRPYRNAWPEEKALQYIRGQAGRHFDPKVVEAFLRMAEGSDERS
ncbi:MAG: PAS domain S-box protein [Chloroflexi bacterium]|nr:PAS domain S-box protein [Chloroflexota bacterium]